MTVENHYDRVVFKVSGESLKHDGDPLHPQRFHDVATAIAEVHAMGVGVIVVVGGGNLWRGQEMGRRFGMDPVQADIIGMFATGMNVGPLTELLRGFGYEAEIFARGSCENMGAAYDPARLRDALDHRKIALLAGGMGVTGISTDVAAVSAAIDGCADAIIMSKFGVDGVYDRDPRRDPGNAVFLAELDASDALDRKLAVMDATALAMARDHGKPIHVIPASETWGPRHVVEGKQFGSKILPQ